MRDVMFCKCLNCTPAAQALREDHLAAARAEGRRETLEQVLTLVRARHLDALEAEIRALQQPAATTGAPICTSCGHPEDWHEVDPDTGKGPRECSPPDLSHCACVDFVGATTVGEGPRVCGGYVHSGPCAAPPYPPKGRERAEAKVCGECKGAGWKREFG